MNSDYVIGGKGQPALFNPDWAARPAAAKEPAGETANAKKTADRDAVRQPQGTGQLGPEPYEAEFSFDDFLDIINPLQHIPVVNVIYRELTGDKINPVSQIAGSTILGGPLGLISGVASAIFEEETGKGIGETVVAGLFGDDGAPASPHEAPPAAIPSSPTMLADAQGAGEKPVRVAAAAPHDKGSNTALLAAEPPAKKAFGGVLASKADHEAETGDEARAAAQQAESDTAEAMQGVAFTAPAQKSHMENGKTFYSLAGINRMPVGEVKMPLRSEPDVRLKPIDRQAVARPAPLPAPAAAQLPPVKIENPEKILGLSDEESQSELASVGAAPLSPSPTMAVPHGRNPLPPQLIEDMMLMNLQKYQDGLKAAPVRGSQLDVDG